MASQTNNDFEQNIKLKILTLNVRGLKNKKKRRSLFDSFKLKQFDIICLQETYLSSEVIDQIQKEWGGIVHSSEGVGRSKGILTLFNKNLNNFQITKGFTNARCLVSKLKTEESIFIVCNVYAPCVQAEKHGFFKNG